MFASQTTVTWRRWVADGGTEEGNPTGSFVENPVDMCAVWFEPSTERTDLQEQVETLLRVVFPPGHAAPGAADQISFLGAVYEVVGEPLQYFPDTSMTIAVGPDIRAKRVSG